MENQGVIDRIKRLGDIVHSSRAVYGLDYSDLRSKHPTRVEIGKEPAHSSTERRLAIRELKVVSKNSLDEEVREAARQHLKRPDNFTYEEMRRRMRRNFCENHPILEMCGFVGFMWIEIVLGVALIYGAAKLYSHFYGQ